MIADPAQEAALLSHFLSAEPYTGHLLRGWH